MCRLQGAVLKERHLRTAGLPLQKVINSTRASEVACPQRKVIDSPVETLEATSVAVPSSRSERLMYKGTR